MSTVPETRFTSTREGDIAYQVLGEGPIDQFKSIHKPVMTYEPAVAA